MERPGAGSFLQIGCGCMTRHVPRVPHTAVVTDIYGVSSHLHKPPGWSSTMRPVGARALSPHALCRTGRSNSSASCGSARSAISRPARRRLPLRSTRLGFASALWFRACVWCALRKPTRLQPNRNQSLADRTRGQRTLKRIGLNEVRRFDRLPERCSRSKGKDSM